MSESTGNEIENNNEETQVSQSETQPSNQARFWESVLPPHIRHVFIPRDIEEDLLPGETVLLEVHLAWYRNAIAFALTHYTVAVLVATISLSLIGAMLAYSFGYSISLAMQLPFIILLAMIGYGLYERFQYLQWRLVKTNNRIIISMPQPDAWYLVDNIELVNRPQVIDSNWSDNQARRFMQALTGSRDLYISLVGLQFVQGTAKVKDALVVPDVSEDDIRELKLLIFG